MDITKMLLAFSQALQNADANLANDPGLKQLRNKLDLISLNSEIMPKEIKNIQGKLVGILENNVSLKQFYQEAMQKLENVEITVDLLPTTAELKQATPPNRQVKKLGFKFEEKPEPQNYELLNDAVVVKKMVDTTATILKNENWAKTSQKLLQPLQNIFNENHNHQS